MITELSDLPAGVVGFEATGTLTAEDYRDVVLPALERALASGEVRAFPLAQRGEAIAGQPTAAPRGVTPRTVRLNLYPDHGGP